MKKFLNDPADLVDQLLEGFALANAGTVRLDGSNLVVRAAPKPNDKVALVTMGGSGHEPALSGFVGEGMLDISVPGEIFAAPGPPRVLEALRMANRDAGVLFVVLNHEGDVLSSNMALEMATKEGLKVKKVLTHEDISSGSREDPSDRRGLVGCLLVYKMAGAAAEQGRTLDECLAVAEGVEKNMATLAVAVTAATHPATGEAVSTLGDDEMVIGMGQHGEAGGGTYNMLPADKTVDLMVPALLDDLKIEAGEKVLVLINGVGATTLMEQYIVLRRVREVLEKRSVEMVRSLAGNFLTVQEMGGFQMCICR
ncbi:MAG: dihydroxyacetone kinase subunit DhaK, partial [Planctomycetota bacterium]